MPVEFLTDEQRRLYGRFHGEPTLEDLARYFHLDDSDRSLIALHRGDHNRLGFAVQLCAVRYVGAFPADLTETPAAVVSILGRQLSIEHPNCFAKYCTSRQQWDHTVEIRERGGYLEFSDGSTQFRLNRWLYALCWTGTDRPGMLFDRATTWLITHKVLLPGATVLVCGDPDPGVHHREPGKSVLHLMIALCAGCHAKVHRTKVVLTEFPPLLLVLWREQHPEGHEQTYIDFNVRKPPAQSVPLNFEPARKN